MSIYPGDLCKKHKFLFIALNFQVSIMIPLTLMKIISIDINDKSEINDKTDYFFLLNNNN